LTCWPSSIFSKSPRIDAPMLCSSRFERHAEHSARELEQLLGHHRGHALDVRDSVTGVDDRTDLLARGVGGETRDVILDRTLRCQSAEMVNSAMVLRLPACTVLGL
jgi:hypothetical protein